MVIYSQIQKKQPSQADWTKVKEYWNQQISCAEMIAAHKVIASAVFLMTFSFSMGQHPQLDIPQAGNLTG